MTIISALYSLLMHMQESWRSCWVGSWEGCSLNVLDVRCVGASERSIKIHVCLLYGKYSEWSCLRSPIFLNIWWRQDSEKYGRHLGPAVLHRL